MKPQNNSITLYRSKVFLSGLVLLGTAVIARLFGEEIFNGFLGSLYFLPVQLLIVVAPYVCVPLIGGSIVWFLIQKARFSTDATLRLRFALCAILAAIPTLFFHMIVTQTLAYRIGYSDPSAGSVAILLITVLSLIAPIVCINFLLQYIKKSRQENSNRKLNSENMLFILLMLLISLPLFAAYYIFMMPMMIFFIGFSSASY